MDPSCWLQAERELKTRAARFGVGSSGISDAKLTKKLATLSTSQSNLPRTVVSDRANLSAAVQNAVDTVVTNSSDDLSDPATRIKLKESAKSIVTSSSGHSPPPKAERVDSVHLGHARKQISLATSDLPKRSDYDSTLSVVDTGGDVDFKPSSMSDIQGAVQGLPEKEDFTRRSETIDMGVDEDEVHKDSPKAPPMTATEESDSEVEIQTSKTPMSPAPLNVDSSWESTQKAVESPPPQPFSDVAEVQSVENLGSPGSVISEVLEEGAAGSGGGSGGVLDRVKGGGDLDFSDDDISEDELP